jgi:hypothetical protein
MEAIKVCSKASLGEGVVEPCGFKTAVEHRRKRVQGNLWKLFSIMQEGKLNLLIK